MNTSDEDTEDRPGQLAERMGHHTPPPSLETRVLRSLAARANIPSPRPRWGWRAVGVALLVIGFALGSWRSRPRPASNRSTPRFALMLYADRVRQPMSPAEITADVKEHVVWARELARGGHFVDGEKFDHEVISVNGADGAVTDSLAEGEAMEGFFVVSAADRAEAIAIARSSPHFRHGGRVIIRKIDST